ncbi:MAG: two-component regulator propeller domain-containing protein [Candidatus Muiribacteriota bacterium]
MKKILILLVCFVFIINISSKQLSKNTFFSSREITDNYVTSFCVDGSYLWIGTYNGLNLYSNGQIIKKLYSDYDRITTNEIKRVSGNSFIVDNRINDMVCISNKLYVATEGGLSIYEPGENVWSSIDTSNSILESNYIETLAVEGSHLWIGTFDSGLYVWDTNSGNWDKITGRGQEGDFYGEFSADHITSLKSVSQKNIIVAGTLKNGVYIYENGRWRNITTKFPSNSFLPTDRILSTDYFEGVFYFGTNRGIVTYDGSSFKLYNKRDGIDYPVILTVAHDDENVYFGTGRGLYKFAGTPERPVAVEGGNGYRIRDIAFFENEIFIATQNNGVITVDK